MDEESLITAAVEGDREAFSGLVRLHQARLRALVALTLHNRDDVLEVVQDSFVDAWRGLASFDRTRAFGPWLRTICRNRTLKFLRDRLPRRRRELALVDEVLIANPGDVDERDEPHVQRLLALRRCLERLAADQRDLLQRRYAGGAAVQELAAELGKTPNAVSMILQRLKVVLHRCVEGARSA